MLLELSLFFALASALTTIAVMVPGLVRARGWVGVPVGLAIMAATGWLTAWITGDPAAGATLVVAAAVAVLLVRLWLSRWSVLAAKALAMVLLASISYLAYAAVLPFTDRLAPLSIVVSYVLLLMETFALMLSVYYLFEILDVFSRRTRIEHVADPSYRARVALQVPCYNEPIEVMRETSSSRSSTTTPGIQSSGMPWRSSARSSVRGSSSCISSRGRASRPGRSMRRPGG
jgi:hypothetical protein